MNLVVIIASVITLCHGNVIPQELPPKDNSHYVAGKSQYIWMDNGKTEPQLVDVKEVEESINTASSRNGAENQYWLFTRRNPNNRQVLVHGNANSVWNSNFISSRPLMVVVHGWNNHGNSPMNPAITSAFLAAHDGNVIVVDWSTLASNPNYGTAAAGIPSVGEHLGSFLVWLYNTAGGNPNYLHLVGFSLGAHAVGVAGRFASARGFRPARVTGLDPAGPGWYSNGNRIQRDSGNYVETIHTNGDAYGINQADGHANFYPNGGTHQQPGCATWALSCSHGRANDLFASSVISNHFIGRSCGSVQDANNNRCTGSAQLRMGNAILNKSGNGIFHLSTGASWPF